MWYTKSNRSAVMSSSSVRNNTAAAFTNASTRPKCATACGTTVSTCSASPRSTTMPCASAPSARTSLSVPSRASVRLSTRASR